MLALGEYHYTVEYVSHTLNSYKAIVNTDSVTPAHFRFTLQPDIDYIEDKNYVPFNIYLGDSKTTLEGDFHEGGMGDVPNGS
jgi:hypothetical protein